MAGATITSIGITSILLADDAVVITLTRFDLICFSYLSIYISIGSIELIRRIREEDDCD